MPQFECDCCGACCRGHLLVEAYAVDVLREPRLIEADLHRIGLPLDLVIADLQREGRCLLIAGGTQHPCRFLGTDNHCSIYPTRPTDCVGMQAGDEQCQYAREAAGLSPLQPTGKHPAIPPHSLHCPACGGRFEVPADDPQGEFLICTDCEVLLRRLTGVRSDLTNS